MKKLVVIGVCLFLNGMALAKNSGIWLDVNGGFGAQPHVENQNNQTAGIEVKFFSHKRSEIQSLDVGLGYTYLEADTAENNVIHAISLYPQLTLKYKDQFNGYQPYFYVRALGSSLLSSRRLGERTQGKHFAFQAQLGVGIFSPDERFRLTLAYKHFSNANLFSPNDGIDVLAVLGIGYQF